MVETLIAAWVLLIASTAWRLRPALGISVSERGAGGRRQSRSGPLEALDALGARVVRSVRWLEPVAPRRVGAILVAAVVALPVLGPLAIPGAVTALAVGRVAARRSAERAVDRSLDELGPVIDLLRVGVSAGLSVGAAVETVAHHAPTARSGGLERVALDVERGSSFDAALDHWARDAPAPVGELVALLRSADRGGVAIVDGLERLARDFRRRRRRRSEVRARRLPVTMLVPLVVCILPAFALVTVVPLLAVGLGHLADVG